jgi:hypothetical protein
MTDIENLDEFVKTLTTQITEGIPDDYHLNGDIEVELSIITSKKMGGKLNIMIAEAGGKYQKEELSKIKFKISKRPSDGTVVIV